MKNMIYYKSPIGNLIIVEEENTIIKLCFKEQEITNIKDVREFETPLLKKAKKQLEEYFEGKRKKFDLALRLNGTSFQNKVWKALLNIPYAKTCSYKDIAKNIGNENASRAVGNANNKNPLPIFIPCHRVIGSNGKLIGYAGGLDIKIKLLELERKNK
ncbi:methylated-DNA--[protein]-cysteine S-methyltransferase [Sarcina sp. JB2]|uniref:Methylated-DNA--[protein]-cysteine S-methyltransferase n=1 Tax=Candidatus Sarcina troglodytae TaxID=2726954 RepID=A0ACD1BCX4_9CLOT|nr:methylated-DNA--[protein]-cysteine S-methyltransferase [Sarcina sp. JB2]QPJ85270.1 methylated-DNA--[protein]-cysteine S-methyltransferase [Sarcina sp. JB2]